MSGIYYTDLIDILQAAGVQCSVSDVNAGWESRSRSSGGFPAVPLAVFWHHTASKTTPANDLAWQCHNCPDKPVGNMLMDRDGIVWPVAAGASNCAGKGGPASFSRGTIALDKGNTGGWQIEIANNGVGEPYPQAQIDSMFRASNALNAHFGNQPTDIITHHVWAPTRKIDPARAEVVQGPWQPRGINSSGTWSLDDLKAECLARAGAGPGPVPPLPGGDNMNLPTTVWRTPNNLDVFCIGNDNACWHLAFDYANGWYPWENLGGVFSGDIGVAIANDGNRIDLMGRGQSDGPLFQRTWEQPTGWSPDWVAISGWPG